jgi:hypothetical protein
MDSQSFSLYSIDPCSTSGTSFGSKGGVPTVIAVGGADVRINSSHGLGARGLSEVTSPSIGKACRFNLMRELIFEVSSCVCSWVEGGKARASDSPRMVQCTTCAVIFFFFFF